MTEKKASPSRKALQVRARARNKKPNFVRAESWRFDRFSVSWRKPRGLDNKIRRKILGWPSGPCTGYKGPKVARYLHPSGFKEVIVYNIADLSAIDVNTEAIRIAHRVGARKRTGIVAKATELNLKILNLKVSPETEEEETEEESEEVAEGDEVKSEEKKETKEAKKPKKETKAKEKSAPKKKESSKKKETKPKKKETKKQ
jgi:large subunit ribosomal protein L32e